MSAPKIVEEKYYRFSSYSDKIYNPKVRLAVEMAFDAGCNMVRVMKHLEDVDSEYEITIDTPEFSIHAFGDIWVFRVSAKFFDGRDYFSARRVIDCDDEMLKAVFKGMRVEAQVSQYLISYLSDNPDFHLSLYTVGETLVKGWDGDMARVKITGNDSKYDINHVEVEVTGPDGSFIDFETTDNTFYLDLWRAITDAFRGVGVTRDMNQDRPDYLFDVNYGRITLWWDSMLLTSESHIAALDRLESHATKSGRQ
mgnify:FL=1|jgi:hypothetical protein